MTAAIRQRPAVALISLYSSRREEITKRLEGFSRIAPAEYFYELAYCLLTPQSSALHAEAAVEKLRAARFREVGSDPASILADGAHYIRFHNAKAKRLLRLRETISDIEAALASLLSPAECRSWLVDHVDGLGLKEATHFLRNIGRNGDLAILDRHILRNLKRYGVLRSIPRSLGSKDYLQIERRFQHFARTVGIPINHLDLFFWSAETGIIRK